MEIPIEIQQLIESLHKEVEALKGQIAVLEEKLSKYEHPKNSSNSSLPPSLDPYRIKRTESLRPVSGRKAGGQQGHAGSFLEMVSEPNLTIEHIPHYCRCCGKDLSDIPSNFVDRRQVIDIPAIHSQVIEHRMYGKECSCGEFTVSQYPDEAHSPVCYGQNLQTLTAYFHGRQYLPYERLRELYSDVFGLSVSSGSLVNMVQTFASKASGIYEAIRQRVARSSVTGADETGICIRGKNGWTWVFQTPEATYIHPDNSRSRAVIDRLFPQGFPQATLVHDCWKPYFKVHAQGHQICTAHLLRELKYLDKLYPNQQWSSDFAGLLHRALALKKSLHPADYLQPILERRQLEDLLETLLCQTLDSKQEKLIVFRERMIRYRNYLFRFLYRWDVPPDNNASERAVRTFKVKQKVSGLFRSDEGAKAFAVIRSVIDTTIKNAQNVLMALTAVAKIQLAE